ncbi:hypothetical protein [Streptomyces sp. DH12]|uniref:hypothetical protein n=1 Tax=Streptomyces sp. DH12 TaxID=2857010 RepID=UPI001E2FBAFC|nr:hypothetical protein [Streptomyces sp. DH12]
MKLPGFGWLAGGHDRQLAATTYAGCESATERAARKRRTTHRTSGADKAAARGQAWEEADRNRERRRR